MAVAKRYSNLSSKLDGTLLDVNALELIKIQVLAVVGIFRISRSEFQFHSLATRRKVQRTVNCNRERRCETNCAKVANKNRWEREARTLCP